MRLRSFKIFSILNFIALMVIVSLVYCLAVSLIGVKNWLAWAVIAIVVVGITLIVVVPLLIKIVQVGSGGLVDLDPPPIASFGIEVIRCRTLN